MTYEQWEAEVPSDLTQDTLWRVRAYCLALFLSDLAWLDSGRLARNRPTAAVSDQLFRSASNVSSNISEGYSRGTGKDRARFYEYALGSVREARDWYYKARHVLETAVVTHRLSLCSEVARLVLKMVSQERTTNRRIRAAD